MIQEPRYEVCQIHGGLNWAIYLARPDADPAWTMSLEDARSVARKYGRWFEFLEEHHPEEDQLEELEGRTRIVSVYWTEVRYYRCEELEVAADASEDEILEQCIGFGLDMDETEIHLGHIIEEGGDS